MTNDANKRETLNDIWDAWTLTPNDDAAIEKQHEVLPVVAAWLEAGKNDPEIVIRAVQLLLADPERPDLNKRGCWKTLRKTLNNVWKGAGTGDKPFFYVQALLLATWPQGTEGHFRAKHLMDSGWDIQERRTLKDIAEWRKATLPNQAVVMVDAQRPAEVKPAHELVSLADAISLKNDGPINHIEQNQSHGHIERIGPQLVQVLKAHDQALERLKTLARSPEDVDLLSSALATAKKDLEDRVADIRVKSEILWWGQSRYCRTLRKPYRRLKSDKPALLWWAAREAAELSQSIDVEPAAAYLVQTLEDMGQTVDDKKPVLEWMRDLHATLLQGGTDIPALSTHLDQIAGTDALGLPVTWVRRKAAQKEPFNDEEARNDVALPLDELIDLGDWASWIFRETLLDLHLAENK